MKKGIFGFIIGLFFLILASTGCYYDKEETLYPNGACDTALVKYSNQVVYTISNKCYNCHNNGSAAISGGGYSFEGYANLSGYLAVGSGPSVFLNTIKHTAGYSTMPKDQPKLTDCEIRTIEIWIQNGFPNN